MTPMRILLTRQQKFVAQPADLQHGTPCPETEDLGIGMHSPAAGIPPAQLSIILVWRSTEALVESSEGSMRFKIHRIDRLVLRQTRKLGVDA